MKSRFYFIVFTVFFSFLIFKSAFAQPPGEWTWMHGSDTITNAAGVFGTQGVPDPANTPPGFYEPVEWTDKQGNFWLFTGFNGGVSFGVFSDVWKFDPTNLLWTWMHGPGVPGAPAVLGTQGVSSPLNSPGGFQWCGATWVDTSGNFWLFGGSDGAGACYSLLWKYDPLINEWTWMHGPPTNGAPGVFGTQGISDPANYPTARWETNATWTDNNNNLWLYGGLNANGDCLWKYDPSINEWTWIKGSNIGGAAVYGTLGVSDPANTPGYRKVYAKWKDDYGHLWLFAGGTNNNDLWKYVISTNEWTWMSGISFSSHPGNYGPLCNSSDSFIPSGRIENRACWYDDNGTFWVFGGNDINGEHNDLWKYCLSTNEWTWVSGDQAANVQGVYGTKGVSSPLNKPGARMGSLGWKDNTGNLWMWGGWVGLSNAANDLWRFVPDPACGPCSVTPVALFSAPNHICPGTCTDFINLSTNANSFAWSFPGGNPSMSADANPAGICYNTPGNYDVTLIAFNGINSDTLALANFITVYPSPPPQGISQSGDTLFANQGAVSYQWYQDGVLIPGATDYFYIADTSGNYNVIATDLNSCEVEAVIFDVIAGLSPPLSEGEGVTAFPNPVKDILTVNLFGNANVTSITVYNFLGEIILKEDNSGNGNEIHVDCRSFAEGIYFIEILNSNNYFRSKFIKQ